MYRPLVKTENSDGPQSGTNQAKNRERILLPVIYTRKKFTMPANLESLWKLKYQPESTLVNFWERLIKSFDDPRLFEGLTEELKKMDFPP